MIRKKNKIILGSWLAVFIWAGLIFFMSYLPGQKIPSIFILQDAVYHFLIYLVFAWLLRRALGSSFLGMPYLKQICLAIAIGLVYAFTDEWHQLYVPNRTFSFADIAADTAGLFTAAFIHKWQK